MNKIIKKQTVIIIHNKIVIFLHLDIFKKIFVKPVIITNSHIFMVHT